MISLSVSINKRRYAIGCSETDSQRVSALAQRVDEKTKAIAAAIGDASEGQVLVLAAITLASELEDVQKKLLAFENELIALKNSQPATVQQSAPPMQEQEEFVRSLENMASRMENLAAQLKSA